MKQSVNIRVEPGRERRYFTVPFPVPDNVERLDITYSYIKERPLSLEPGITGAACANIIDLALQMPGGVFVGASGSDRSHIWVSAFSSAQGYRPTPIQPGEWRLIIGAYLVCKEGVDVNVEIEYTIKSLRLFLGDAHMHTTASDGTLDTEELAALASKMGLDFICLTNHNNDACNATLPQPDGLTLIPGMEWTHYRGHANLLGAVRPMENPFCVNDAASAREKLQEGKNAGAMLVINHPFSRPECGWDWGFDLIAFDAVEVWNGALMTQQNVECLRWWQNRLCEQRRIPVIGGSDFHRPGLMSLPGLPTTAVYALSREPADLLCALRCGNAYIKMTPDAPDIRMTFPGGMLGEIAPAGTPISVAVEGLQGGDVVRRITDSGAQERVMPPGATRLEENWRDETARFVRYEIVRTIQLPLTILVTNPIYFGG